MKQRGISRLVANTLTFALGPLETPPPDGLEPTEDRIREAGRRVQMP